MNAPRQRLSARDYKGGARQGAGVPLHYRTFGAGLAIGLAVALAVFVVDRRHKPEADAKPKPQVAAKRDAGDETPAAADPAAQFDFYSMLPNAAVEVPQKGKPQRDTAQAAVEQPGAYVLQVGSYRNRDDAERLRSKLDKLGIEAKVQHVSIDADELHRVLVGPIRDLAKLNATRRELRAADFDVVMYRVGD